MPTTSPIIKQTWCIIEVKSEQVILVGYAKGLSFHNNLRNAYCKYSFVATGVKRLLQYQSLPGGALHFAAVEGVSCQTGLLDGPAALLTSLLACGSTSDAGLAAIQAGQAYIQPDLATACRALPIDCPALVSSKPAMRKNVLPAGLWR